MAPPADEQVERENDSLSSPKVSLSDQDPEPGLLVPGNDNNHVRLCNVDNSIEQPLTEAGYLVRVTLQLRRNAQRRIID